MTTAAERYAARYARLARRFTEAENAMRRAFDDVAAGRGHQDDFAVALQWTRDAAAALAACPSVKTKKEN